MLLKRKRLEKSRDLRKISRLESSYAKAVEGNSLRRLQLTNKTKKKIFFLFYPVSSILSIHIDVIIDGAVACFS